MSAERSAVLWWLVAAAGLMALRAAASDFMPALAHDSFQYLSVAEQTLRGRLGQTALVHFDAERSFASVPAPMVTFPLGYPTLMAVVALTGLALPRAALLINVASALGCVPLLWWITGRLGLRRIVRHTVLAFVVVNASFLLFATTASTETFFTLVVLAAIALLFRARSQSGAVGLAGWIAAGVAFGLAYHVRYAGLFLVIGLGVVAARHLLARNRTLVIGYATACAAASALVVIGMARNVVLVGNWRGGNEKAVTNPLGDVLEQSARALNGLVLGPLNPVGDTLVPRALFGVLIVLVAVMLWRGRSLRRPGSSTESVVPGFSIDVLTLVLVYSALMFYAALTTVISYGTRMFVPMIPLLALLVGVWLSAVLPRTESAPDVTTPGLRRALASGFGLYAVLNLLSLRVPPVDRATPVIAQMNAITDTGLSVREVIARYATEGGVIVANNGQAIGYILGRPTISLVGPHYSQIVWDEQTLRDVVTRYAAAVVVITAPNSIQLADSDMIPAPFVGSLASGRSPHWLRLVSRSGPVFVYVPVLTTDRT